MTKINYLKRQVLKTLEEVPETRDSDITLMLEIWKRYYPEKLVTGAAGTLAVRLSDLYNLPREDNVKRIRAHFQNDQLKFLPTYLAVAKQRRINEEVWRRSMGQGDTHGRLATIH